MRISPFGRSQGSPYSSCSWNWSSCLRSPSRQSGYVFNTTQGMLEGGVHEESPESTTIYNDFGTPEQYSTTESPSLSHSVHYEIMPSSLSFRYSIHKKFQTVHPQVWIQGIFISNHERRVTEQKKLSGLALVMQSWHLAQYRLSISVENNINRCETSPSFFVCSSYCHAVCHH